MMRVSSKDPQQIMRGGPTDAILPCHVEWHEHPALCLAATHRYVMLFLHLSSLSAVKRL